MLAELQAPVQAVDYIDYETFLTQYDSQFAEWVDGRVILMSPISVFHDEVQIFLIRLLAEYVEERDLGRVLQVPFQMRLRDVRRGREPDLSFVRKANAARLTRTYIDGPADLAIEIVSPESEVRDREAKFLEYQIGGVGEYWIIDPDARQAEFYQLEQGHYVRKAPDAAGVYRASAVEGFWLDVNWLWQQPMPKLREVLRQYETA
jgi:Uma2 family endonuclease